MIKKGIFILKSLVMSAFLVSTQTAHAYNTLEIKQLETRFLDVKNTILDGSGHFSFTEAKAELLSLIDFSKSFGETSQELLDFYDLYTLLLSKKLGNEQELIKYAKLALKNYNNIAIFTADKELNIHYRMYRAYEELSDFSNAIDSLRKLIQLAENKKLLDNHTILGQKEQLGYLYHETAQYNEALKTNLSIENMAIVLQVDKEDFINLYNNIAQNYYKLNELNNAENYLNKRLNVSTDYDFIDAIINSYFQLAVLKFETNNFQESKRLFKKRVEIASSRQSELVNVSLNDIKEDLEIYYKKMK